MNTVAESITLPLTKSRKRVFLLGPSHHFYLTNCALSTFAFYETPLGDLKLDQAVMEKLYKTGKFGMMKEETDEDEHSLELHLPYIYKVLSKCFGEGDAFPTLVPILVGNTSRESEKEYGAILAPYLADPESIFIISSDFAHWGLRFQYTYYLPANARNERSGTHLRASDRGALENPKIYESIERVDKLSMDAIKAGDHDEFLNNLQATGNTVCGRHPIGIIMAAVESLVESGQLEQSESAFNFVRYTRSSNCVKISDSSVSYAGAYAIINCKGS